MSRRDLNETTEVWSLSSSEWADTALGEKRCQSKFVNRAGCYPSLQLWAIDTVLPDSRGAGPWCGWWSLCLEVKVWHPGVWGDACQVLQSSSRELPMQGGSLKCQLPVSGETICSESWTTQQSLSPLLNVNTAWVLKPTFIGHEMELAELSRVLNSWLWVRQ